MEFIRGKPSNQTSGSPLKRSDIGINVVWQDWFFCWSCKCSEWLRGRKTSSGRRCSGLALQSSPTCNWVKEQEIDGWVTRGGLNFKRNWCDWFFFFPPIPFRIFRLWRIRVKTWRCLNWVGGLVECLWVYLKDLGEVKQDGRFGAEQLYFFLQCAAKASTASRERSCL